MAEPFYPNHGISGQYVCGADGVMRPAVDSEPVKPEPQPKPAATKEPSK